MCLASGDPSLSLQDAREEIYVAISSFFSRFLIHVVLILAGPTPLRKMHKLPCSPLSRKMEAILKQCFANISSHITISGPWNTWCSTWTASRPTPRTRAWPPRTWPSCGPPTSSGRPPCSPPTPFRPSSPPRSRLPRCPRQRRPRQRPPRRSRAPRGQRTRRRGCSSTWCRTPKSWSISLTMQSGCSKWHRRVEKVGYLKSLVACSNTHTRLLKFLAKIIRQLISNPKQRWH